MKPTKNRIFCQECRRPKMLFETEKKALLFMKFNNDEIASENETVPTRAYFCRSCGGWHLTHYIEGLVGISKTDRIISEMREATARQEIQKAHLDEIRKKEKEAKAETAKYVTSQMSIVDQCSSNSEFFSALVILDELIELSKTQYIKPKTLKRIRNKKEFIAQQQQDY